MMDLKWSSFLKRKLSRKETSLFSKLTPIFLASALVVGVLAGYVEFLWARLALQEKQLAVLEKKTKGLVASVKKREKFFQQYREADEEFLKHSIEPIVFLKKDLEVLLKLQNETYAPLLSRVQYLSGEANRMKFVNTATRALSPYKEKEWRLEHKVELNKSDLKQVLSLIEGQEVSSRPQLMIKKIKIDQIDSIFSIDLEVLQRGPHAGV